MVWFLKARRALLLTSVLLLVMACAPFTAGLYVSFPSLHGGSAAAGLPLAAVFALGAPATLGLLLSADGRPEYRSSVRNLRVMECCAILVWSLAAVAAPWLSVAVTGSGAAACAASRNALGLIGVFLIAAAFLPWAVAMSVPTLLVFMSALLGRESDGLARWAWPLAQPSDYVALTIAVVLWVLGLVAALIRNRTATVS